MTKQEQILKKLGFNLEEIEKDEFDVENSISEYQTKQQELFLQRGDILEPIKEQAKKEANIIATKKIKKAINNKLGLGLSEKDLAEKEIDEMIDEGTESLKNNNSKDITELQQKLIETTNKVSELEQLKETEIATIKSDYETKFKKEKILKIINEKIINDTEFIAPTEKVIKAFFASIESENITIDIDDNDNLKFLKKGNNGTYDLLTKDNGAYADLDYLKNEHIGFFIKQSNGNGSEGGQGNGGNGGNQFGKDDKFPEGIPAHMIEALKNQREREAQRP